MRKCFSLFVLALLLSVRAFAQADRTVPITGRTDIERELFKHLVVTKQASQAEEYKFMYHRDLLKKSSIPGVAIYQFGIETAHAGYNVAFQYRDKLIFPGAVTTGRLLTLCGHFLTKYPKSFTFDEQKQLTEQLFDVVEHNETLAKLEELPDK